MDLSSALAYFSPKGSTKLSFKRLMLYAVKEFAQQPIYYIVFSAMTIVLPIVMTYLFQRFGIKSFPAFLLLLLINPPLQLGTAAYLHHKHETQQRNFLFFFRPFKWELIDIFIFNLIVIAGLIIITLPAVTMQTIMEQNNVMQPNMPLPLSLRIVRVLTLLGILYVGVGIIFAPYYIYFYGTKPFKAIKQSYELVKPSWFWFCGLYLGIGALVFLSLLGISMIKYRVIFILLLISLPIARIASYYVFARYSGIDKEINQEA